MSERDPVVPYNTEFLSDWCSQRGIDYGQYGGLYVTDFRIAGSRTVELSAAQQLRREIIASLPLENCSLVNDPRIKPGSSNVPKVYKAPDGTAFELKTSHEYTEVDEWEDDITEAPTKIHQTTFIGEYLDIATRVVAGEPDGTIKVFEQPAYYAALPISDPGITMAEQDESRMIRLPSRYDPEKDGAYVAFSHITGWDIVRTGNKASGEYGRTTVELVPFEREVETELYVANFDVPADELDDFDFFDEAPLLPPGSGYLPTRDGEMELVHNAVGNLILPPIEDRNYWTHLWERHGIMIKWNPTVTQSRFTPLDFDRPLEAARNIREYNSLSVEGKTLGRALVVRNMGTASLSDIVRLVTM